MVGRAPTRRLLIMTSNLYDIDASTRRVAKAERAVSEQRVYVAKQTDPVTALTGRNNLVMLEDCLDIQRKNHSLITEVVMMRMAAKSTSADSAK